MSHKYLILQGSMRLDTISKHRVCRCADGGGQLLYDYRKRKFILEGRCKLMLLCTIIRMKTFEQKLRDREILSDFHY